MSYQQRSRPPSLAPLSDPPALPAFPAGKVLKTPAKLPPIRPLGVGIHPPESGPAPREMSHHFGITGHEHAALQATAQKSQFDIEMRTADPTRLPHVGSRRSQPKPAGLYQKTSKVPGPASGLVTADEGAALPPFAERSPDGIVRHRSTGRAFHSDLDLQDVRDSRTRKPVPEKTYIPLINEALDAGSRPEHPDAGLPTVADRIQHGAHNHWGERNDMTYAGGVNAGMHAGQISFGPGRAPRAIYTVGEYERTLTELGRGDIYSAQAWQASREREADKNADKPPTVKKTTLHPR